MDEYILYLDLDEIDLDENQPRKTFEEGSIGELAMAINKQGLIEPIKVTKKGARYKVIDGERRYRAYKLLRGKGDKEYTHIPAIVLNPKETLIIQLASDIFKEKLNPLDEGEAFKKLLEKYSLEDVSHAIGKRMEYVRDKVKLTCFNENTKKMIKDGLIPAGLFQGIRLETIKGCENKIMERIVEVRKKLGRGKTARGLVRRIINEETQRYTHLISNFNSDLERFFERIRDFRRAVEGTEIPKLDDTKLDEALKTIKDFLIDIEKIKRTQELTLDIKMELEQLRAKYGNANLNKLRTEGKTKI